MTLFDIIVLAIIQGITEFLPISSSGHLALWPLLTGRADQGVTMDVAVHLGTLVAVMAFFRRDMWRLARGAADILRGRTATADARLTLLIAVGTVPAVLVGAALKLSGGMAALRTIEVIGWTTLTGGILLWIADRWGAVTRRGDDWTLTAAILMGLAQACALVPGTSRSGACMTMARALGYERAEAARLALLMAVPTILAAGLVETAGVIRDGTFELGAELALGAALSCLAALAALWAMMALFSRKGTMAPFAIYRLVLGGILLWITYA